MDGLVALDGPALNSDFAAVVAGLNYNSVFLDADNQSHDTAGGNNLITDLNAVSHFLGFFILLALRANQHKVKYNDQQYLSLIHISEPTRRS